MLCDILKLMHIETSYLLLQGLEVVAGLKFRLINLCKVQRFLRYLHASGVILYKENTYLHIQGILLVYDITNKWSFDGIDRWIKEIEEVCKYSGVFL